MMPDFLLYCIHLYIIRFQSIDFQREKRALEFQMNFLNVCYTTYISIFKILYRNCLRLNPKINYSIKFTSPYIIVIYIISNIYVMCEPSISLLPQSFLYLCVFVFLIASTFNA